MKIHENNHNRGVGACTDLGGVANVLLGLLEYGVGPDMIMVRRHAIIAIGRLTHMMDTMMAHAMGIIAGAGRRGAIAAAIIIGWSCAKPSASNWRKRA